MAESELNQTGGGELQVREAQEVDLQQGERGRGKIKGPVGAGGSPYRRDGFDEKTVQEDEKKYRRETEDDPQREFDHA